MKAKKFINNSSRVIAAFLLAGAMVVAVWSVMTYDRSTTYYSQNKFNNIEMNSTADNNISNADMKQMKEINVEIVKLAKKKAKVMGKLEKAKADRNKDHGMVAGMYFQPAQDIAEITNLEKTINKLDNKIAALDKQYKNIAEKQGSDVQQLALR